MMKRFLLTVSLVLTALLLSGCCFSHDWQEATCENPRTCAKCGETEGNALGHDWKDADCETPQTCFVCDATKGKPLGHDWQEANCETPKTCSNCNATEGAPLDHQLQIMAMYHNRVEGTCLNCGENVTEDVDGQWDAIAQQVILGHWTGIMTDINTQTPVMPGATFYVEFNENGQAKLVIGDLVTTGSWEYYLSVDNDGGAIGLLYLYEINSGPTLPFLVTCWEEDVAKVFDVKPGPVLSMQADNSISLFSHE